ncbi:MAG: hypothetical protein H3C27_01325 [Opitutaceae bacterium]|nr:hypothetical protein [Opitutaceae bacterium]
MKANHNHEAAAAVLSAGSTGSEALAGAPATLESILQDHINNRYHVQTLENYGLPANAVQTVDLVGKDAFAIVEDGHIHVGLIHADAAMYVLPIFEASAQLEVCYEYGGAWIHSPLMQPSWPLITATTEQTVWDYKDGAPSIITQASLYVLRRGRMEKLSTKPARSHYCKDAL